MKLNLTIFLFLFSIININAQNLYFPPTTGNNWETTSPESLNFCQNKVDSLYTFLETNNTKAFILLKDGKIVLEKYFGTHTQSSNWYWASAGKTITSFMVGIAQQENLLSINDATSKYLGKGWTSATEAQEDKITILNQLTMTSGLDDGVADPYCTTKDCLIYKADAGSRWAYHNGPYTLLDKVIENASGTSYNNYVTQKLKSVTGMTGQFYPSGSNNVFFSNARSMARFGLLILNKGNWNGTSILKDTNYFDAMTKTSQNLNKAYGYLWWLNGSSSFMVPQSQIVFNGFMAPKAPADMICALGKNGQFMNVVPSQNLVWIRMGEAPTTDDVPFIINNDIWSYINEFQCKTLANIDFKEQELHFSVVPNPANEYTTITSKNPIGNISISNINGQVIYKDDVLANEVNIPTSNFSKGLYFISIKNNNQSITKKLFVN